MVFMRRQSCWLIGTYFAFTNAFVPTGTTKVAPCGIGRRRCVVSVAANDDDVYVMVNGMPGPMATAAAEACLRKGLKLSPIAMTGPNLEPSIITVLDPVTESSTNVKLIPSDQVEEIETNIAALQETVGSLLAIDYTHPSAVNVNAKFYVKNNVPFVMGTTGGDRDLLLQTVQGHFCVIAPNMGKQIVAMQAALEDLGTKYPAAFEGYTLEVTESHQKTKADTSGTAKAVIDSIQTLSADTTFDQNKDIVMLRNEEDSVDFGVPRDSLNGHAFHTYTLTSPDKSVQFELKHNVAGRTIYAEGTADAVKFLSRKLKSEPKGRVFNMINVLEEGALE